MPNESTRKKTQLVFIVGSGRSGTTLLRNLLDLHPDIAVTPELKFFDVILANRAGWLAKSWSEKQSLLATRMENKYQASEDPLWIEIFKNKVLFGEYVKDSNSYKEVFEKLIHATATKKDAKIIVEKTPANVFFLNKIVFYFPEAKIINIVRDGREVCASAYKRGWAGDYYNIALWWTKALRVFKVFKVRHQDSCFEVRYESLVNETDKTMKEIFLFLQVSMPTSFADDMHHVPSFSSFVQGQKGIYESKNYTKVFKEKEQEEIEGILKNWLAFYEYLLAFNSYNVNNFRLLKTKIKLESMLLARKYGLYFAYLKVRKLFGK